jgi:hypothetical protein
MTEMTLFGNMPTAFKDMLAQLEPETNLTGGDFSDTKKISIRGSVFRKVVGGNEVAALEDRTMDVVVVKSAPISRTFYAGTYVEGESSPPTCWTEDTKSGRPSEDVLASDAQAASCSTCPQNIKGSGQNESRACKYQQRVVVILADEDGTVNSPDAYLLSIPATSVFGDDKKKLGMQTYARHLNSQRAPLASILTTMKFDTDSTHPKLSFAPARALSQAELELAVSVQKDPDTAELVAMKITPKEKEDVLVIAPAPDAEEEKVEAEAAPAEEPKAKVKASKKKKKPEPTAAPDLSSLLDEFDD